MFGGEFTVFKAWREVLHYAYQKGFFISFVSNGYLIDEADAQLLADCGVRQCTISVHGPEEVHDKVVQRQGSFQRAMRSIALLRQNNVTVTVAYTPNAANLRGVFDFVEELKIEHGIEFFSISRLFSDDRYEHLTLSDYHYLLEQIDKCHEELGVEILLADSFPRCQVPMKYWRYLGYCSQGVGFAQVDFNGNIKHCSATSMSLGNVLNDEMSELWGKKLAQMRDLTHLPKSCKICPIFCGGGCTVSRGVEHQFAPDEFIPWPSEENWLQAIGKAAYNRVRKVAHRLKYPEQYAGDVNSSEQKVPKHPKIRVRYQTRLEGDGVLVMFEGVGVRKLSQTAHQVLTLLDGVSTIESIHETVRMQMPQITTLEIEEIISSFPVE